MKKLTTTCFLLMSLLPFAQFTEVTSNFNFMLMGSSSQSGCGVSFYDYDHDGWDDLTIGQTSNEILVYRNDNGNYQVAVVFPNTGDPKQLIWVDYDNDGDSDFFFTVTNQSAKLFRNDGNNVFTDVTANLNLPSAGAKSFGASWGDYDNDSFLDVYICNYSSGPFNQSNWLLHNNGDGTFSDVTVVMGVGNGVKPSYQCSWNDVNQDGLLDLYLVNDFSYINELYLNNGTTFDAAGAAFNLNIAMEGMSIIWSDMDHDLDWDVFIADNLPGNKLMRNDNNVYTDIATSAGVLVNSTCWGSLWLDYDHDGYDDLHICTSNLSVNGNQNLLYHNNGDYTYTDVSMANDNDVVFASTKGDMNNDGFWDFIEMKQYPSAVALYQNNGGENHWVKIGLTGTASNRDAVGTMIRYFTGGQEKMTGTFSGESFLGQDSQYEILSLGENTVLDSIHIHWPNGWTDRYYNLAADEFYTFTEGETFQPVITNVNGQMLCPAGGEIELMAEEGVSYLWNDESTDQNLFVVDPGTYTCEIVNEFGISGIASYNVEQYELPVISSEVTNPSCNAFDDGCIVVTPDSGEIQSISWDNESSETTNCNLIAGEYNALITDQNGCQQTITVVLEEPLSLELTAIAETACYGSTGSVEITGTGGTPPYSIDLNGNDPSNLLPGDYTVVLIDDNDCEVSTDFTVEEYPEIIFTYVSDTVCFGETLDLQFDVSGVDGFGINWNGNDPDALPGGEFFLTVTSSDNCQLGVSVFVAESPEMILTTNVQNAENGDNGEIEVVVNGGIAPFTYLWNGGEETNPLSGIGSGDYTVIVTDAAGCSATATATVIDISIDEEIKSFEVYPNPFDEFIVIRSHANQAWRITDLTGKVVSAGQTKGIVTTVELATMPSGLYLLQVGNQVNKLMKR